MSGFDQRASGWPPPPPAGPRLCGGGAGHPSGVWRCRPPRLPQVQASCLMLPLRPPADPGLCGGGATCTGVPPPQAFRLSLHAQGALHAHGSLSLHAEGSLRPRPSASPPQKNSPALAGGDGGFHANGLGRVQVDGRGRHGRPIFFFSTGQTNIVWSVVPTPAKGELMSDGWRRGRGGGGD